MGSGVVVVGWWWHPGSRPSRSARTPHMASPSLLVEVVRRQSEIDAASGDID